MFFYPQQLSAGDVITLPAEESHHAIKVLRSKVGDELTLLNGQGGKYKTIILQAHPAKCEVRVEEVIEQQKPAYNIHIALANLKKRDRIEWFIEKAVELGAGTISLFRADHTEKLNIDAERCKKIAISALKQSGNLWLPDFHIYTSLKMLLQENIFAAKFIAHCETDDTQLLKYAYKAGESALLLIGPEGDFSKTEIELALSTNCTPVNLGPLRLRAETAALTGLLTLQLGNM